MLVLLLLLQSSLLLFLLWRGGGGGVKLKALKFSIVDQNYTLRRSKCEIPGLKGNSRNIVQLIHHPYWTSKTNTNPSVALTLSVSLSSGHGSARCVPPRLVTWIFGYAPHPQERISTQIYSMIIYIIYPAASGKKLWFGDAQKFLDVNQT